jgi:hypothetical protein
MSLKRAAVIAVATLALVALWSLFWRYVGPG